MFGRVLGVGEMRRMMYAESIIDAYHQRENWRDDSGQPSMADWANKHKGLSRLLNDAAKIAEDIDDGQR